MYRVLRSVLLLAALLCLGAMAQAACSHPNAYYRANGDFQHERYCDDCQTVLLTASHDYDEDHYCDICGHDCTHASATYSAVTDTTHTRTCSACGWTQYDREHSYRSQYSLYSGSQHIAFCECNKSIFENHEYNYSYATYDSTQHKAYCICGDVYELQNHSFVNGVCTQCNAKCQHVGTDTVYVVNETMSDYYHYQACALCGQATSNQVLNHSYTTDGVCSLCSHKCAHNCDKSYTDNGTTHSSSCSCCGAVLATGTAHTYVDGTCSACGHKCTHSGYTLNYTSDGASTHHSCCSNCGKTLTTGIQHTYNSNGACSACGYECIHDNYTVAYASDDDSAHHTYCSNCGKTLQADLAHCYSNGTCKYCQHTCAHKDNATIVYVNAQNGTHYSYCTYCNLTLATGTAHTFRDGKCTDCDFVCYHTNTVAYTSDNDSTHHSYCTVCKQTLATGIAHTFSDGKCSACAYECKHTNTVAYASDNNATHHSYCTVCNKTVESGISHTYTNDACTVCAHVCTHTGADPDILLAQAATCTQTGLTEGTECHYCAKIITAQQETPTVAHKYTVRVPDRDIPATDSTPKLECYKCASCDELMWQEAVTVSTFNATASGLRLDELIPGYSGVNGWRMVTPIDLSTDTQLPLIAGNQYIIGAIVITVTEGGISVRVDTESYAVLEPGSCYYLIPIDADVDYSSLPDEYKHEFGQGVEASGVMLFFPAVKVTVDQSNNDSEWFNFNSAEYAEYCEGLRALIGAA